MIIFLRIFIKTNRAKHFVLLTGFPKGPPSSKNRAPRTIKVDLKNKIAILITQTKKKKLIDLTWVVDFIPWKIRTKAIDFLTSEL